MRILLTDDDDGVRACVGRALQLDGHLVATACDGIQAMEVLTERDGAFDLLVSDVRMPLMDGISLALRASSRWPRLPILLITGYAERKEWTDELRPIVRDVLPKPFSLEEIRAAVSSAVAPPNRGGADEASDGSSDRAMDSRPYAGRTGSSTPERRSGAVGRRAGRYWVPSSRSR